MPKRIGYWLLAGCVGAALIAGFSAANPYVALYRLRRAAERGDTQTLTELIDFDRVRTNLKMRIRGTMAGPVPGTSIGLGMVGAALVGTVLDPMVDSVVSPQTIGSWVQGIPPGGEQGATSDRARTETHLRSWSEVTTTITRGNESLELVLTRDFVRWRVTDVRIDLAKLAARLQPMLTAR